MSELKKLYDYYNDVRNEPYKDELLLATGISRIEILKILAVLIIVEKKS